MASGKKYITKTFKDLDLNAESHLNPRAILYLKTNRLPSEEQVNALIAAKNIYNYDREIKEDEEKEFVENHYDDIFDYSQSKRAIEIEQNSKGRQSIATARDHTQELDRSLDERGEKLGGLVNKTKAMAKAAEERRELTEKAKKLQESQGERRGWFRKITGCCGNQSTQTMPKNGRNNNA